MSYGPVFWTRICHTFYYLWSSVLCHHVIWLVCINVPEKCGAPTCRMEAECSPKTLVPPTTTQSVIAGGPSSKPSQPCNFGFCITLTVELICLVTEWLISVKLVGQTPCKHQVQYCVYNFSLQITLHDCSDSPNILLQISVLLCSILKTLHPQILKVFRVLLHCSNL